MTKIEFEYKTKDLKIKVKENSFTIHSDTLELIQKILDHEQGKTGVSK